MHIQQTDDFSVKFGRQPDLGMEGQKAFPFVYTFVNANDAYWRPHTTLTSQVNAISNLSSLGPVVPANSKINIAVRLDADYNFKLLSIKYSVYGFTASRPSLTVPYTWYENINATQSDGMDVDTEKIGTPLFHYINMTLSFQGSGSQIIYGGDDPGPLYHGRIPLHIDTVQGYDYGYMVARTPYLLPMQGIMSFDITNSHPTSDLVVCAAIYGMKIRL